MKPFVLSLEEMRRIWGPEPSDAELIEIAKRASEFAYVLLEEIAERRAGGAHLRKLEGL